MTKISGIVAVGIVLIPLILVILHQNRSLTKISGIVAVGIVLIEIMAILKERFTVLAVKAVVVGRLLGRIV